MTTTGTAIDDRIQAMLDKEEIREVLYRYARGVDRVDAELVRSVYHDDAYDDHGSFRGLGLDFVNYPPRYSPDSKMGHHGLCQIHIELDGDVALVETYFIYHYHRFEQARGEDRVGSMIGRYVDRFERREGQWRIAFRRVVLDGSEDHPLPKPRPGAELHTRGQRWPDDEIYHPERLVRP